MSLTAIAMLSPIHINIIILAITFKEMPSLVNTDKVWSVDTVPWHQSANSFKIYVDHSVCILALGHSIRNRQPSSEIFYTIEMLHPEDSKTSAKHLRTSKGSLIMGSYSLISDPVEVLICSYPESGLLVHLVGTSQATPSNYLQGLTLSTARLVLTSGGLIYYILL